MATHEFGIDVVPYAANATRSRPILTAAQRRRLMALATRQRLPARTIIYREGDPLSDIFVVSDGLVKSFRELASGKQRIVSFLFPRDVFGLAERGRYVNTTRTVVPTTIYRLPQESLTTALQRDPDLQFRFLCKVTQKLRESQRQAIALSRRDAIGRVAMFLKMLEAQAADGNRDAAIHLPMRRADIADYLGLSPEAVSRAIRALSTRKLVTVLGASAVRVKDRDGFESLVAAA
jgi:CRP/FNR family transcriptional regulator